MEAGFEDQAEFKQNCQGQPSVAELSLLDACGKLKKTHKLLNTDGLITSVDEYKKREKRFQTAIKEVIKATGNTATIDRITCSHVDMINLCDEAREQGILAGLKMVFKYGDGMDTHLNILDLLAKLNIPKSEYETWNRRT